METDTICLILFLCPVPNSPDDNDLLQLDLDSMCSWSVYWSLKFNAEKSFLLRISRKRKPSEYTYIISGAPISITDSHRDLGVVVSNNLKWSVHVAHCTSKANCMLGFLPTNCAQMTDVRSRRLLYIALARSHLSYASEVWAPQSSGRNLALIEGVQRKATKFILPHYELPYRLRLIKLNLLPISYWLELKDLLFFLKCKQGYFDVDISQYLTFSSQRSSRTRSSQANNYMLLPNFCRTSLFRAFFFNRIVFLWNGLPSSLRDISSVSSFKHNLFSYYLSKLNSDFDVDRMRSWKTFCSKCRSYNINCCS